MGFIVKKDVEVKDVGKLSEFYVNIDKYTVYRNRSCLDILAAHFYSPEAAKSSSGLFFGDIPDYDGYIPTSMSFDGRQVNYNPRLSIDLYVEESGFEPYTSASVKKITSEYIDFNDDGEEVLEQEVKYILEETISTTKLKKNIHLIEGNIYKFAYEKLKEKYNKDFYPCEIEDV